MTEANYNGVQIAIQKIRARAREERDVFGDETRARCLEWAAAFVEQGLRGDWERVLTLDEASALSGYSKGHLGRLVRDGKIPDLRANRHARIFIRWCDLPKKPPRGASSSNGRHGLASSLSGGEED